MGSTFKPHILVEKLVKLNSSQQSIETLSHWCIFHMNKAKNVVETWDRQFHCSPREQRLAFLYLANDILQNSRRKGSEFVSEFWKVLPDALRVVLENGDKSERNSALRLINIWEERKVFGSQGQLLKEELVGKNLNTSKVSGNPPGFNLTNSAGNALDKIASAYQVLYGGQLDEETILHKCMNAIRYIEKVDKEIGGGISSEQLIRAGTVEEIKGQQAILMGCIEQLIDVQSCRTNLVSYLTEALDEQEVKLSHLRHQLQDAQSQSEQAENLCRQIMNTVHSPTEKKESHNTSEASQSLMDEKEVQTAPVMYTTQVPYNEKLYHIEENSKSAVAAPAAPVTASTSSAQVLPHVLPSFASDGVIVNTVKGPSNDYSPEKKLKLESGHSVYLQSQIPQPPVPPYPHPDSLQHHVAITSTELTPQDQPPLPSSPPPMPPLPPSNPFLVPGQFMPSAGSIASVPYNYGLILQQPPPFPFPAVGSEYNGSSNFPPPPAISYQNYQNAGRFYGQQSFPATPVSRQL